MQNINLNINEQTEKHKTYNSRLLPVEYKVTSLEEMLCKCHISLMEETERLKLEDETLSKFWSYRETQHEYITEKNMTSIGQDYRDIVVFNWDWEDNVVFQHN